MTSTTIDAAGHLPAMVLHVLNSATGGAAKSTIDLIVEFNKQGIHSCAVCDTRGTQADREVLSAAVEGRVVFTKLYWTNRKIRSALWKRPIHELLQLVQTGFQRRSTMKVMQAARQYGADMIHTNTIVTDEGGLAARRLGLPHVWHLRELLGPGKPCRLSHEGRSFGRYMAAHCSKLVANSQITAALVRDWLPDGLLEVVPNGIDISRFELQGRPAKSDRLVVAMVGNITARWKKHGLLVDAAARVDRSLPIEWRIYGNDPSRGGTQPGDAYTDDLHQRIARAGLTDRFAWPGFVADPAEMMSQIDLLVHPCDHESFGRIIVEGMAAGLPVVGVRGGGVGEIVQHGVTGLLAANDDPQAMAACIEQLARDARLRQAMGVAGRARAEAIYSLQGCAAGVLRVYAMAMARPRPRKVGVV